MKIYDFDYRYDPEFSDRQVRANSADQHQTAPRTAYTVKFLNFGTPEIFAVIYLKF